MNIGRLIGWCMGVVPTLLFARTPADSTATEMLQGEHALSMGWLVVRTILTLILILALIFGLVYLFKKYFQNKLPGFSESRWVQVLGRAPLGPKQAVVLIKIADRVLLLGVTENSVSSLAEFTGDSNVERWLSEQAKTGAINSSGFWKLLKQKVDS